MRKGKKFHEKFLMPLAMAGVLFAKGCSLPLPEYKEYKQPKKVILHGTRAFDDPGSFVSAHLEDMAGRHKEQHCDSRIQLDSVVTLLGEAKYAPNVASLADEKDIFYKLDIYGEKFWIRHDKDFHEINDENVIGFLARNHISRIPSEIRNYVKKHHLEQSFRAEMKKAADKLTDRKLPVNMSQITRKNYVRWISDYFIHYFRSLDHYEHDGNYISLLVIATDESLDALVSDVIQHRHLVKKFRDGSVLDTRAPYAGDVYENLKSPRHRRRIEDYLVHIATDTTENCKVRCDAVRILPRQSRMREELRHESMYVCNECHKYCYKIDDPNEHRVAALFRQGLGRDPPRIAPCKEDNYPCLCLKMYFK